MESGGAEFCCPVEVCVSLFLLPRFVRIEESFSHSNILLSQNGPSLSEMLLSSWQLGRNQWTSFGAGLEGDRGEGAGEFCVGQRPQRRVCS